jgi:hypothetical protein
MTVGFISELAQRLGPSNFEESKRTIHLLAPVSRSPSPNHVRTPWTSAVSVKALTDPFPCRLAEVALVLATDKLGYKNPVILIELLLKIGR